MEEDKQILAWFLGAKSENAAFLEEALLLVLRDYFHWRGNYFPSDDILLTRQLQREIEPHHDMIYQRLLELLSELRRNFPFYSPRYIAHMLSDTVITSTIGYIAGLLYNPNNVTPEAAPVTVDMEIRACNALLRMLGFSPPPEIPKELNEESIRDYKKSLEAQFGWGHLTLGGTTANLEALWVARAVKYSPLAIWDIARREDLSIEVKFPDGSSQDIRNFTEYQLLLIKPNEAIYLLAKYVAAYRLKHGMSIRDASEKAYNLLATSPYHLSNGVAKVFSEFPPVVLVSGTAHYSIEKAADILGIGRANIEIVAMDSTFRMDISDLEKKLKRILAEKKVPLAVIAIIGTTEEGAVDPLHTILDLRQRFEQTDKVSFWIHADAAWGGYIRALLNLTTRDEIEAIIGKVSHIAGLECTDDIQCWHSSLLRYMNSRIDEQFNQRSSEKPGVIAKEDAIGEKKGRIEKWDSRLRDLDSRLRDFLKRGDLKEYLNGLRRFVREYSYLGLDENMFRLQLKDRIELVRKYVSDVCPLRWGRYSKDINLTWGSEEVLSSLLGISSADSVTIDPHKMGYVNYPCGMIAFRNDRVRHFVLQQAPYITSARQDILVHMPPQHIEGIDNNPRIQTDAFAPFIVEGSRPGAAASALWLTIQTIPPTMKKAGAIVKSSILAARELYEWLVHWQKIAAETATDVDYLFIPLTMQPPDTNIVIFAVKKKTSNSLLKMNQLTQDVYEHFTIQAELGEREYSYAQPFFLSKTKFREPRYPFAALKPLFSHYFEGQLDRVYSEYKSNGLTVLRATVMNPYLWLARVVSHQLTVKEFVKELSTVTSQKVKLL